jgi:flagellar motor switch protein FliG
MTVTRQDLYPPRPHGPSSAPDPEARGGIADSMTSSASAPNWPHDRTTTSAAISSVRKAAIVLVSLDQSLASQLLSHLDRSAVEAVTWEIARLERIDPDERAAVLEEFYGLGLRRLCFVFDDIVKMSDGDIRAACHDEDLETWALALAGAAATVRNKVLAALAAAPASRLRHDLDHLGPFRLSDSEAAQLEIAERLRRLYDHGRIVLPDPNGREEVLV